MALEFVLHGLHVVKEGAPRDDVIFEVDDEFGPCLEASRERDLLGLCTAHVLVEAMSLDVHDRSELIIQLVELSLQHPVRMEVTDVDDLVLANLWVLLEPFQDPLVHVGPLPIVDRDNFHRQFPKLR